MLLALILFMIRDLLKLKPILKSKSIIMKKLFIIAILSCNFLNAQSNIFPPAGNVGIGTVNPLVKFVVNASAEGQVAPVKSISIIGPNQPENQNSAQDLSWDFGGAGSAIIRSYRGRAWDTSLQFLTNPYSSGNAPRVNMHISSEGNVGVGTVNPLAKFVVNASAEGQVTPVKSISIIGPNQPENQNSAQDLSWDFGGAGSSVIRSYRGGSWDTSLQFLTNPSVGGNAPRVNMHISSEGNVGIGTVNPGFKLDVIGTIRAREVKVNLQGADFVFEDGYKLMPLNELEEFVKQNKHLPEIAPAKDMQQNGSDLGSLSVQLLQKIEELTLHAIEQNKKMNLQNKEINFLKKQNKEIKSLKEKVRKLEQK